jgi:hypothetical protein
VSKKDSLPPQQPAPKRKKDPNERIRKIGEREEVLEIKLTEVQRDKERHNVMFLLDQVDELEEKKKEVVKNYASQLAAVELQIHAARQLANSGKRRDSVTIEEWLTGSNDIIRIRADTGEQVGDLRRARAEELQEKLLDDTPPPDDAPSVFGEPDFPDGDAFEGSS